MTSADNAIQGVLDRAVEAAVRKALNVNDATNRRLFSIEEGAAYLSLSKREVYNMTTAGELPVVRHGRRKMLDILDLNEWIERCKDRRR